MQELHAVSKQAQSSLACLPQVTVAMLLPWAALCAGGMTYGAGRVAADKYKAAEIVDPRPFLQVCCTAGPSALANAMTQPEKVLALQTCIELLLLGFATTAPAAWAGPGRGHSLRLL